MTDDLHDRFDDLLRSLPPLGAVPATTVRRGRRRRSLKVGALGGAGALAVGGVLLLALPTGTPDRVVPQPGSTPSAAPSPAVSPSPSPAAAPVLALTPDGLALVSGSSTRLLPFGETDQETVEQAVAAVLGAPTQVFDGLECGHRAVEHPTLAVRSSAGRFVGWTTNQPGLRSVDGIGVGSTLAEVRAAAPDAEVRTTSLGVELSAGVNGVLDGTDETSRVVVLSAGDVCAAR